MNTERTFSFKSIVMLLTMLIIYSTSLFAQPQHYNYQNVGSSTNSFPFSVTLGKQVQWFIGPGTLNMPVPVPPGQQLTKLYFFTVGAASPTFTTLMIKLGQANISSLPTGAWYAGQMDTVYYRASVSLSSSALSWMVITLDRPFVYNPALSLIVEVGQCGATALGMTVRQNAIGVQTRSYSGTTGCPHTYSGQDGSIINFGVDVSPAATLPNLLYYKFERNPNATTVINCGTPGVGTPTGTISGTTLGSGGQFDTCMVGAGATSSGVVTGWNTNLSSGSWTISFWTDLPTTTFGYLFGDPTGSFRCFNNGAAGTNGLTFRGTGITNVDLTGFGTGPVVVHYVYDSAMAQIRAYKNGVLSATVPQTPLNLATGTGFKVGGWSTAAGYTGKLDEFRVYRRALNQAEITATWNTDIGDCNIVGIGNNNNSIPTRYNLEQNYPNPFNPTTSINFAIPKAGLVDLKVFDILGREVIVLINGYMPSGNHTAQFDASPYASGVYFYTLNSGGFTATRKMLLVK
jgi:Concanavalin A-like lectin/glucanases superfamily/Secretion system C-terminal sorting domain